MPHSSRHLPPQCCGNQNRGVYSSSRVLSHGPIYSPVVHRHWKKDNKGKKRELSGANLARLKHEQCEAPISLKGKCEELLRRSPSPPPIDHCHASWNTWEEGSALCFDISSFGSCLTRAMLLACDGLSPRHLGLADSWEHGFGWLSRVVGCCCIKD